MNDGFEVEIEDYTQLSSYLNSLKSEALYKKIMILESWLMSGHLSHDLFSIYKKIPLSPKDSNNNMNTLFDYCLFKEELVERASIINNIGVFMNSSVTCRFYNDKIEFTLC